MSASTPRTSGPSPEAGGRGAPTAAPREHPCAGGRSGGAGPAGATPGCAREAPMKLRKLALTDATMERSPGQDGEIFTGNLVDERHGGPVTIGYGRWGAGSSLTQTMAVDDIMIV